MGTLKLKVRKKRNLFFGYAIMAHIALLSSGYTPVYAMEGAGNSLDTTSAPVGYRNIVDVENIEVFSPAGTVPRLPYQVWVT